VCGVRCVIIGDGSTVATCSYIDVVAVCVVGVAGDMCPVVDVANIGGVVIAYEW